MRLQLGNIQSDYQRWLKSYMRHLKYKESSKNTIEVYTRILTKLQLFIDAQNLAKMMQDMNKEFFLDFMEHSEEQSKNAHFSKKTKQLYVSVLKSFFTYISDNNDEFYTYENEFKIAPSGVNKGKKIKYLSDEEVYKIIDYLDNMRQNRGSYYDFIYALGIKLMLFGGLRISEVLGMRLGDISVSDLRDENSVQDIYEIHLPVTKSAQEQTALIKIIDIEEELSYFSGNIGNDTLLFTSQKNNSPIHRSNFYIGVKTIMEKAGINKKGLHIYRHTCAMQLYRKSRDILVTKEKLRHSDIKTTMIYAQAEKSDVAMAMR
ncbi:MAG: tyrosine-type recombinase/integrase [Epsilonproteobacteria bacterium]|nr:tyrosine-type recombinase/integrase [Campylobacterota bacterium]